DCMERLSNYRFPGNVRELENILERAFTLCDNDVITAADIQLNAAPVPGDETDLTQIDSLEDFLDDIERKALTQALEETRWNKTAAARRLGLTFRSLRYRLKKLGLED
ncbi:MAG: helix-turn-helix domain-containing protein, partial [Pseudomonadaceae bacterium]|nr:helix-turn-helix domain-containing protein [Pseudomonadaceae bacterium]